MDKGEVEWRNVALDLFKRMEKLEAVVDAARKKLQNEKEWETFELEHLKVPESCKVSTAELLLTLQALEEK